MCVSTRSARSMLVACIQAILHARYVLTDVGGVQFADGLDEGVGTGVPTMITRLSYDSYRIEWDACERDVYRTFVVASE